MGNVAAANRYVRECFIARTKTSHSVGEVFEYASVREKQKLKFGCCSSTRAHRRNTEVNFYR